MTRSMKRSAVVSPVFVLTCLVVCAAAGADGSRFRGADGSGVFAETGLLRSWGEGGPKELWFFDGLGEGYASVSVAAGRIYTTGMTEQRGVLYALDLEGELLFKKDYGPAHSGSGFPGTRTTPTVDGDTVYLLSSMGKAAAFDAATGETHWEVDVLERFDAKNIYFGISESPLIVDDKVIFTPGGKDASVVALDKASGETVWTTKGLSDGSAYCTPRLYGQGEDRRIITFVAKHLVGIAPDDGTVLWRHPYEVEYDIHATSPVFHDNLVYVSHGYKQGGKLFELAEDCAGGKDCEPIREKWSDSELDVHHGGAVFVDGYVYGAASGKTWYCLDGKTGKVAASIPRLGKGSVIYAEGRLYGYVESGKVLLVNADPSDFRAVSSFEIERGSGHHWAHPVLAGGVLYIRHGEVLMAFDVRIGS